MFFWKKRIIKTVLIMHHHYSQFTYELNDKISNLTENNAEIIDIKFASIGNAFAALVIFKK